MRDVLDLPPGKARRALSKWAKFKSVFSARIGETRQGENVACTMLSTGRGAINDKAATIGPDAKVVGAPVLGSPTTAAHKSQFLCAHEIVGSSEHKNWTL